MTAVDDHVGLIDRLRAAAASFVSDIEGRPGVVRLDSPDFQRQATRRGMLLKDIIWQNDLFVGGRFRRAHVEFFSIAGQIGVLHVCVFPRLDRNAPIFGFDIIAGMTKATGAFLDLSPTTRAAADIVQVWASATADQRAGFAERRTLPPWAESIFSADAVAIRPVSPDEVEQVLELGRSSLALFLAEDQTQAVESEMFSAQVGYVVAQRSNEHTFRMLANCVGPELAREFIDGWLFPYPLVPLRQPTASADRIGRALAG